MLFRSLLAVVHLDSVIDISEKLKLPAVVSDVASLVVFALIILCVLKFSVWKKQKKAEKR